MYPTSADAATTAWARQYPSRESLRFAVPVEEVMLAVPASVRQTLPKHGPPRIAESARRPT